jgi:hypothetical protein
MLGHAADRGRTFSDRAFSGTIIPSLVSWLRAELLGHSTRAATYRSQLPDELSSVTPLALRRALLDHAAQALSSQLVSREEISIWDAYRGLSKPPRSAVVVAAQHGVTSAYVVSASRRVERVLARRQFRVTAAPSPTEESQRELAELHTSLMLDGAQDVPLAAFADLQRERGVMVPSPRGIVERHLRQQAKAALRRRLDMGYVRPSLPSSSGLPALDPEFIGRTLAADSSSIWATRDQVAAAVASWQLERRPVTDVPLRFRLEAWHLRLRLWREDEDIRALYGSRVIRLLAGRTLGALYSLREDAVVLEAHGYQRAAAKTCEAALSLLPNLKAPPEMIDLEYGSLFSRLALALGPATSGGDMNDRHTMLDRALECFARGDPSHLPTQEPGMARNRIDLELTHHRLSERHHRGRPGRPGISRERIDSVERALDLLGDPMRMLVWRITKLRWALAAGDTETFVAGAQEFVDIYLAMPEPLRNQARRYRTLLASARSRGGRDWRALDLPPVPTDARLLVLPGEPATWIEGK